MTDPTQALQQILSIATAALQGGSAPPPNTEPPAGAGVPDPTGIISGPDISAGSQNHPTPVVPVNAANDVIAYSYRLDDRGSVEFKAFTEANNAAPSHTWQWVSLSPGGPPLPGTGKTMTFGEGVASITVNMTSAKMSGATAVYFNDQVSAPTARRAQVA